MSRAQITPPERIARMDLFVSKYSAACQRCIEELAREHGLRPNLIFLDTQDARRRAMTASSLAVNSVPTFAVVDVDGGVSMYVGARKILLWGGVYSQTVRTKSGMTMATVADNGEEYARPMHRDTRPRIPDGFTATQSQPYAGIDAAATARDFTLAQSGGSYAPPSQPPPPPQPQPQLQTPDLAGSTEGWGWEDSPPDGPKIYAPEMDSLPSAGPDGGGDSSVSSTSEGRPTSSMLPHSGDARGLNMKLGLDLPRSDPGENIRDAAARMAQERLSVVGPEDGPAGGGPSDAGNGPPRTIYMPEG